jgi:hypothetical protein
LNARQLDSGGGLMVYQRIEPGIIQQQQRAASGSI